MKSAPAISPELLEDAAERFIRVRTAAVDSGEHAEWLAWIEADPAHRAAFAEIQQAWDVTGELKSPPWPHPQELTASVRRFPLQPRTVWALAASLVLAVGAFFVLNSGHVLGNGQHFSTGRGEQQSTLLPDGSRIELGGQTSVAIDFTARRRLVVADEGEAFYKVAHDSSRPFVVQAGPVSVTALGTAFSIRREGDTVSVVVTEGSVKVVRNSAGSRAEPPTVVATAGQRVRFDRGELAPLAEPVKTELTTAWRRGRLRFEEEPLRVVVATLNRYSDREIVLADPALAEQKFTGTVFDDRVEDWLVGVQVVFPVRLHEEGAGRILIERSGAPLVH